MHVCRIGNAVVFKEHLDGSSVKSEFPVWTVTSGTMFGNSDVDASAKLRAGELIRACGGMVPGI